MGRNRVFFPRGALDQWLSEATIELTDDKLIIKAENREYRIIEAVRIVAEVTGADDAYALVGTVRSLNFVTELGAELLESSMLLGDLAYDVVPGFLGFPVSTFDEHRASTRAASSPPESEEALLAQYLMHNLE